MATMRIRAMNDPFERFDQIDRRFAKLFTAFVLLLVVGLITADTVVTTLQSLDTRPNGAEAARRTQAAACKIMPDGTRICDMAVPKPVKLKGR